MAHVLLAQGLEALDESNDVDTQVVSVQTPPRVLMMSCLHCSVLHEVCGIGPTRVDHRLGVGHLCGTTDGILCQATFAEHRRL